MNRDHSPSELCTRDSSLASSTRYRCRSSRQHILFSVKWTAIAIVNRVPVRGCAIVLWKAGNPRQGYAVRGDAFQLTLIAVTDTNHRAASTMPIASSQLGAHAAVRAERTEGTGFSTVICGHGQGQYTNP